MKYLIEMQEITEDEARKPPGERTGTTVLIDLGDLGGTEPWGHPGVVRLHTGKGRSPIIDLTASEDLPIVQQ